LEEVLRNLDHEDRQILRSAQWGLAAMPAPISVWGRARVFRKPRRKLDQDSESFWSLDFTTKEHKRIGVDDVYLHTATLLPGKAVGQRCEVRCPEAHARQPGGIQAR
jgi:hypothetical protein